RHRARHATDAPYPMEEPLENRPDCRHRRTCPDRPVPSAVAHAEPQVTVHMSSHFERTRARLRKLLGSEPAADTPTPSAAMPDLPAEAWNADYLRLVLSPTPGIAERFSALREKGVLALLLPDVPGRKDSDDRVGAALRTLDQLFDESTLTGKRFGSLLRE